MKEYRGVRKSLRDLVEGQERNTAQLERIGAAMERRWDPEEESRKENRDEEEGSKDGPGESPVGGNPSSASYLYTGFVFPSFFFFFFFNRFYFICELNV